MSPAGPVRASLRDAEPGVEPLVLDPADVAASLAARGPSRAILTDAAGDHRVLILPGGGGGVEVVVDGWRFVVDVEPEARASLRERARRGRAGAAAGGPTEIRAVIPGRVLSVEVGEGDEVTAGQPVLIVEAMKMQNELRAPRDGRVARVAVAAGQTIELGDVLMVLE